MLFAHLEQLLQLPGRIGQVPTAVFTAPFTALHLPDERLGLLLVGNIYLDELPATVMQRFEDGGRLVHLVVFMALIYGYFSNKKFFSEKNKKNEKCKIVAGRTPFWANFPTKERGQAAPGFIQKKICPITSGLPYFWAFTGNLFYQNRKVETSPQPK